MLFLQLGRRVAPFKRNDAMLDVLPIDVMVFPGTLASRTTSPTRPASSAFRSGGSAPAARERRITRQLVSTRAILASRRGGQSPAVREPRTAKASRATPAEVANAAS